MTDDIDRDQAIADLRAEVAEVKAAIEQLVNGFGTLITDHASAIDALRASVQALGLTPEQTDAAFELAKRLRHEQSATTRQGQNETERLRRLLESARVPNKSH